MMGGREVFAGAAKDASGYLAVPESPQSPAPGVLVLGETARLTGHLISVADRLADEGLVAFAADLAEPTPRAAAEAARHLATVADGPLAVLGFGIGGGLALAVGAQVAS